MHWMDVSVLTRYFTALWLKFWIEASTVNPDTNIAMWSSVYILLGVATLAFVGLKAWCAPGQDLSLAAVPLPIAFTMASERKEPISLMTCIFISTLLKPLVRKPL